MRSRTQFETVLALISQGHNDCAISRLTGIPRTTIRDWRLGRRKTYVFGGECEDGCIQFDMSALPPDSYAYLLGMYLGDGYLASLPRGVWALRISSDSDYPGIIGECCHAMEAVMPGKRASLVFTRSRCVEVAMYSKHWPCLFPQHGPGRKHLRPIRLEGWQKEYVKMATRSFLRGLIHSDGCRTVANDRGMMSVRYHFSNLSEDIKDLYCGALDSLGIHWTRPSHRDIAVYRQAEVAQLDWFIGPKL